MGVKLGNGKWAIKEDKLLAYNDNSGRFFNKEFDFSRGSSATYVAKDGLIKTAGLQETNLVNNGDFSELGSELVTNGNFATDSDWTKQTGWSISGGSANCNTNSSFQLYQDNVVQTNKFYKITYTVSNYQSGGVFFRFNTVDGDVRTANGTYTEYLKATNSPFGRVHFRTLAQGGFVGSIDNVSVKQVDPNDYWTITNNTGTDTIIKDEYVVIKTDGTFTQIAQSNILSIGKTYKLKYNVIESDNGNLGLEIGGSTILIPSTVGTHTFIWTSNNSSLVIKRYSGALDISISNISVQEIQTDTPRIDFSDSVKGALLLEPQRTNIIRFSEGMFDSSYFNQISGISVVGQQTDLNGTNTAVKLSNFVQAAARLDYNTAVAAVDGKTYTYSAYYKGSGNIRINVSTSTGVGGFGEKTINLTDEWVRHSITATFSNPTGNVKSHLAITRTPNNDAEVYLCFAQIEEGSYPTSYIPTFGSSATRLADVCNNSGSAQDFSKEGVLYADISALSDDQTNRRITISDGTNTNRVVMGYNTNSNQIFYFVVVGNSTVASGNYTSSDITQFSKVAIKFKANDFALWVDGVERHTDTSGVIFSENTLTSLQFEQGSGNSLFFYGKVRAVQVFTEALTDEQLQKLTTI